MRNYLKINNRCIGPGFSVYIIAEMSANHNQDFKQAVKLVQAAKEAGADAVKSQTYTQDTLTIDCDNEYFKIAKGTVWEGKSLYDLYKEAYTPWEWQPKLKETANELGMDFFSTPFDFSAVDFLERIEVPLYKIASFEIVDIALLRHIAQTGKPIIMSTGMASLGEIEEAVNTIREQNSNQLALLKCTSAYPASPDEMNLRTIPHLAEAFQAPIGLSDHTLDNSVTVAAVAIGACIIEKHLTLSRNIPGPDSAFSLEPQEFKTMVQSVRVTEKALGEVQYKATEHEKASKKFRRSLFAVREIHKDEMFTNENVRSIRPAHGLPPRYLSQVLNRKARSDIPRGTPLKWDLIS